jgi:phosphatidylinositol glycan class Z
LLTSARPFSFVFFAAFALFTAFVATCVDTAFYTTGEFHFAKVFHNPVITPLNNFVYNSNPANLALHGTHPYYQHGLINLAQLLGPAFPLLFFLRRAHLNPMLISSISGITLLSLFPHQEARFLIPAVPLILSSVQLPGPRFRKAWIATWIIFNLAMGVLMGVYHQGGIVPTQMHIAKTDDVVSHAFWWKTYSPPIWLLNGKNENLTTVDLMGVCSEQMLEKVKETLPPCRTREPPKLGRQGATYLIAPRSANTQKLYLDHSTREEITLNEIWSYRQHLNLDDMDFANDGVWKTLGRVVGDRGLVIWKVEKKCYGVHRGRILAFSSCICGLKSAA